MLRNVIPAHFCSFPFECVCPGKREKCLKCRFEIGLVHDQKIEALFSNRNKSEAELTGGSLKTEGDIRLT